MAIKYVNADKGNNVELNRKEIEFILKKLRESTFKGTEFEIAYSTWYKLQKKLP
jgi:hypothetical protein